MSGPRIFDSTPQDGDPLSKRGVFRGLRRIAEAVENMSVHNGRVHWSGYRPKIIVDVSEGGAGDGLPTVTSTDKNKVLIVSSAGEWEVDFDRFHA